MGGLKHGLKTRIGQFKRLFLNGGEVTATAAEINNLDGLTRGSIIVGGEDDATSKLDAKGDGKILIGDGTDLKSVAVGGDATLANDGTLALTVPKLSYANMICQFDAFTDNTDATGYIDFTTQIPAGAIILGWKAVVGAGFTGNVSATMQVGVAGDLGRFSADTAQSVFAAGTVGSAVPQDKSCDGIGAAVTPRITVTGGSDFSNITAGAMNVYVYYIATV